MKWTAQHVQVAMAAASVRDQLRELSAKAPAYMRVDILRLAMALHRGLKARPAARPRSQEAA